MSAPYGSAPVAPKTNGLAIAALVVGCVSLTLCPIGSVLAVVFGYVSRSQIDRSNGTQSGRGLSMAGIVLGWIGVGLLVILAIVLVIAASSGSSSSTDTNTGLQSLRAVGDRAAYV